MATINQKQRAARAWPILADVAANKSTITYGDLGQRLDIHHRAVRYVLAEIQDYCLSEKLPPITILIVGQGGTPGAGFIAWDVDDLERGKKLVYEHPWGSLNNPFGFALKGDTPESIADALIDETLTPKEAYSQVKVRGMSQLVFRNVLLKIYEGRCAISKFATPELLQAPHIIPWVDANPDQRINPSNGILFSVVHHRFFDLGWIRIAEDYRIHTASKATPNNSAERHILEEINGMKLRLPENEKHWPNPEFLSIRNAKT